MLSIVPTPLGNLEDVSKRSLRVLGSARAVLCEDTRRTRVLMSSFGLSTPLRRFNEKNETDLLRLVDEIKTGGDWALVSDAGMPAISDPGRRLVALSRREKIPVTVLPGPSAVTAALAGSGLPADSFLFLGFLPRSEGKQKRLLAQAAQLGRTIVVYESPFRAAALLKTVCETLGAAVQVCVVRELSKIHEEWLNGTAEEVRAELAKRSKLLGEFVVMVHPGEQPGNESDAH